MFGKLFSCGYSYLLAQFCFNIFRWNLDVASKLRQLGYCADADTDGSNTMNKKVRNAQIAQYNFIFGKIWFWYLKT